MIENHEVEYRALISRDVFRELLKRGQDNFASTFNGPLKIDDAYFCSKTIRKFDEIEMNKVGSYGLRLRREIDNEIAEISLNAKTLTHNADHTTGLEYEVKVESFEECASILGLIGFKIFFEYKKTRYSYKDDDVMVCLEDIENFQPIIEVEIITTANMIDKSGKKLLGFLGKYNIPKSAIVDKSVTNMLMRVRSTF